MTDEETAKQITKILIRPQIECIEYVLEQRTYVVILELLKIIKEKSLIEFS